MTSAGLNLPSLGFLVQDGGRIHETGSAPQDAAEAPELRPTPRATVRSPALGLGSSSPLMYTPRRSGSYKRVRRGAIAGALKRRESFEDVQDLGIRHSSKLHTVEQSASETLNSRMQAQRRRSVNCELDVSIHNAAEDDNLRLQAACDKMAEYLARLKSGSLILEVGSRCGEFTLMISKRFPELYVQPTEGTGETSPALFVLLQQRLGPESRSEPPRLASPRRSAVAVSRRHTTLSHAAQTAPQPSSRVLPPRFLDTTATAGWKQKLSSTQDIHCVFAVNVVQYLSQDSLHRFMQGCWYALKAGGILLMCGPFIDHGEASDDVVVYNGALKVFAQAHQEKAGREREYGWSCHETSLIERLGKKIGFEMLSVEEVPYTNWLLLVLKRMKYAIPQHLQGEMKNIVRAPRNAAARYSSGDGHGRSRGNVD